MDTGLTHITTPEYIFSLLPLLFVMSLIAGTFLLAAIKLVLYALHNNNQKPDQKTSTPKAKKDGKTLILFKKFFSYAQKLASTHSNNTKQPSGGSPSEETASPLPEELEAEKNMKLHLELAKIKEELNSHKKQLDQEREEKEAFLKQKGLLEEQIEKFDKELGKKEQDAEPEPTSETAEDTSESGEDSTEAEKILISEQAAEIRRLRDIIVEFKQHVKKLEKGEPS